MQDKASFSSRKGQKRGQAAFIFLSSPFPSLRRDVFSDVHLDAGPRRLFRVLEQVGRRRLINIFFPLKKDRTLGSRLES